MSPGSIYTIERSWNMVSELAEREEQWNHFITSMTCCIDAISCSDNVIWPTTYHKGLECDKTSLARSHYI
jgi:hypothetical protein